jgi:hypothetical protein
MEAVLDADKTRILIQRAERIQHFNVTRASTFPIALFRRAVRHFLLGGVAPESLT